MAPAEFSDPDLNEGWYNEEEVGGVYPSLSSGERKLTFEHSALGKTTQMKVLLYISLRPRMPALQSCSVSGWNVANKGETWGGSARA